MLTEDVLWAGTKAGAPVRVKIDVETHEPAVLQGASGWWTSVRPALVCELLPGSDTQPDHLFLPRSDAACCLAPLDRS